MVSSRKRPQPNEGQIIDLKTQHTEEAEIVYSFDAGSQKRTQKKSPLVVSHFFLPRLLAIGVGVAIFLLLALFFVYVVIPLVVISALWTFFRHKIFKKHLF